MKILITTEQYYPQKSGIATVVTAIAEELVKYGCDVTVVTGDLGRATNIHNGVKVVEFAIKGGFGNFYRGEIKQYREFILTHHFDIMINECVQTWCTDLILKDLHKINSKKFLHSHGFSLLEYRTKNPLAYIKSKIYYKELYKYLKHYKHIFLLHENTVETSYLNNHKLHHFSYLPNGVPNSFTSINNKKTNENYLLNISNYFPMKNQEFLLEAFYLSKTDMKLILIGDSILKNYLEKLQLLKIKFDEKYGFKEVVFLFNISRELTVGYLENATLFLHSSKLEVFPMVIVEAMAKGIPFISTDVGNVKKLEGGIVINSRNEMAKWIDRLTSDPKIYDGFKENSIRMIQAKYTWEQIIPSLINFIKDK